MEATGTVFRIMRYSTEDGPGLRTTVFLKGCPLSCAWCHNPESKSFEPDFIHHANHCINCGSCAEACPHSAIEMLEEGPAFPTSACDRCQQCIAACPADAREFLGKVMSVAEVLKEILKDRVFYEESGGGLTLSGGEPLSQPEFSRQLLNACKHEDLHTALDTTLHAPWSSIEDLLPHTDLFLVDMKLLDGHLHKHHTGTDNNLILSNLQRLDQSGARIIIRMPVVREITDIEYDIRNRIHFLKSLKNVVGVELLPYHAMAEGKSAAMNMEYDQKGFSPPAEGEMAVIAQRFRDNQIEVLNGE